jgi:hypothetical protein
VLMQSNADFQAMLLGKETSSAEGEASQLVDYQPGKVISLLIEKKRQLSVPSVVDLDLDNAATAPPLQQQQQQHQLLQEPYRQQQQHMTESELEVSPEWANSALRQLVTASDATASGRETRSSRAVSAARRRFIPAKKLFTLMRSCALPVQDSLYVDLMKTATASQNYLEAEHLFALYLADGGSERTPSLAMWEAKACNLAASGQIAQALAIIENMKKLGMNNQCVGMYNATLEAMIAKRQFEQSKDFWLTMHSEGLPLNLQSFEIMMRGLAWQGEVERVFFLFDELRMGYQLQPQNSTFIRYTLVIVFCSV